MRRSRRHTPALLSVFGSSSVASISNLTITNSSGIVVPSYTLTGKESNQYPEIDSFAITGTVEVGQTLIVNVYWWTNSGADIGDPQLTPKTFDDTQGLNETSLTAISGTHALQPDGRIKSTYSFTISSSEELKYLAFEFTPEMDSSQTVYSTGLTEVSEYTIQVPAVSLIPTTFQHHYDYQSTLQPDGTTPAGAGDEAFYWTDLIGSLDLSFVGATAPNNTVDGVQIGSATNTRWTPGSFQNYTQAFEVWLVMKNIAGNDNAELCNFGASKIQCVAGTSIRLDAGTIADFSGYPTDGDVKVLCCRFKGASSQLFINNVESSSGALDAGVGDMAAVRIGTNGGGANWYCQKMLVKTDGITTTTERNNIYAELTS